MKLRSSHLLLEVIMTSEVRFYNPTISSADCRMRSDSSVRGSWKLIHLNRRGHSNF